MPSRSFFRAHLSSSLSGSGAKSDCCLTASRRSAIVFGPILAFLASWQLSSLFIARLPLAAAGLVRDRHLNKFCGQRGLQIIHAEMHPVLQPEFFHQFTAAHLSLQRFKQFADLRGDLRGDLLCHFTRNRSQRHDCRKHVVLDEGWGTGSRGVKGQILGYIVDA